MSIRELIYERIKSELTELSKIPPYHCNNAFVMIPLHDFWIDTNVRFELMIYHEKRSYRCTTTVYNPPIFVDLKCENADIDKICEVSTDYVMKCLNSYYGDRFGGKSNEDH